MALMTQYVTSQYALYHGDCLEVLPDLPDASIHLSIYSPPFCGLYHYSSSERDLSNARTYDEFFEHYGFVVAQIARVTIPGRISAVHCMDIPNSNTGDDDMTDFPGDIIRLHLQHGWRFKGRHFIWKEPLAVRNRTMAKHLAHKTIVEDAVYSSPASADQLLLFQKCGDNPQPVSHPNGFLEYAGSRPVPYDVLPYRRHEGSQIENRYSHWIWRQYASAFWDDIRLDHVLPFRPAKDDEDEKHVHPLQLDVIARCVLLYTNPGDVVLSPFAGVGSEVYGAVLHDRKGLGIELKASYYQQALKNLVHATERASHTTTLPLFSEEDI